MINRTTKLRWRRLFRRSRRQVEDIGVQAEEQLEQHFFKRLNRLAAVRRFVVAWIGLFVILSGLVVYSATTLGQYYQIKQAVPGGIYTEGIIGTFTNANPLYAAGSVDSAVSRLLFSSLFTFNGVGQLEGDLASKITVDEKGTTYTVELKPHLFWHDGRALTAEDVEFTYRTIQNADARSPLFTSWQGVKVVASSPNTITFTLPSVLASFPNSLTNGIVPKHLLGDTPVSQLRSIRFDTVDPVGSGPFKWEAIEVTGDNPDTRQQQIALAPNMRYHNGKPKLQQFKIRTFADEKSMTTSFKHRELTAMSGLGSVPEDIAKQDGLSEYGVPFAGEVGVFFRTTQDILKDTKVRQALIRAVDQNKLIKGMPFPVIAARSPFLPSHVGYAKDLVQLPTDINEANKLLDEAGWPKGKDGYRAKGGVVLSFQLYAQSTDEYAYVTQQLQNAWRAIGVKVDVFMQSDTDIQGAVSKHTYDALLYGIVLGNDPDVFAYWHSSQASSLSANRFNFSEYKSTQADKALEAGRARTDPSLRAVKYRPFLEAWRTDAPAMMLYQPRYLYLSNVAIDGFAAQRISTSVDRYVNVQNWMIRQANVTRQ